jgi:hypothetical protein
VEPVLIFRVLVSKLLAVTDEVDTTLVLSVLNDTISVLNVAVEIDSVNVEGTRVYPLTATVLKEILFGIIKMGGYDTPFKELRKSVLVLVVIISARVVETC